MTVDWNAVRDQAIRDFPDEIVTMEDAIRCSVFVQQEEDKVYNDQPLPHTRRIVRTGDGFTDGACSGYLAYFHEWQGKLLLDTDIAKLLKEWLADEKYSDLFNAGYIVSFVEAVIEDRDLFAR